jgi:hypothetical protein
MSKAKKIILVSAFFALLIAATSVVLFRGVSPAKPAAKESQATPVTTSANTIDCGVLEEVGNQQSQSPNLRSEPINDCFEKAFVACTPARVTYTVPTLSMEITYIIKGKNSSGKCSAGYVYSKHLSSSLAGRGLTCVVDTAVTPFRESFGEASTGLSPDIKARCASTLPN